MYRMVFAQVFRRIIFLLCSSLTISCSAYRVMEIETLQPAQLTLQPWDRIGLLERNTYYTANPLKNADVYGELSKENLLDQFALGMKGRLAESGYSDSIIMLLQETASVLVRPFLPPPYLADSLRKLCERFDLQYLVALEISYYDWQDQQLSYNCLVRLYEHNTAYPLDSVVLKYDLNYDPEELGYILPLVVQEKGAEYACRIVPHWQTGERRIYNGGKVLRLGDAFLKEGETEKAVRVWEGAQNLSVRTALRASINLAWVYEQAGDYEKAIAVLHEARQKNIPKEKLRHEVAYLEKYAELLQERIKKEKMLEQQFR